MALQHTGEAARAGESPLLGRRARRRGQVGDEGAVDGRERVGRERRQAVIAATRA